jgi:hypothetical protein
MPGAKYRVRAGVLPCQTENRERPTQYRSAVEAVGVGHAGDLLDEWEGVVVVVVVVVVCQK